MPSTSRKLVNDTSAPCNRVLPRFTGRAIRSPPAERSSTVERKPWASCRKIAAVTDPVGEKRSEEHTSELQSLMRISYAVFCLKKKKNITRQNTRHKCRTNNKTTRRRRI